MPKKESMFPTHVGMNRVRLAAQEVGTNVPHACGDEPKGK